MILIKVHAKLCELWGRRTLQDVSRSTNSEYRFAQFVLKKPIEML